VPDRLLSLTAAICVACGRESREIGKVTVPTLLLCGEAAPFVSHTLMAEMRALIPAAEPQHYADALDGLIISYARALAARTIHFRRAASRRFDIPHVA